MITLMSSRIYHSCYVVFLSPACATLTTLTHKSDYYVSATCLIMRKEGVSAILLVKYIKRYGRHRSNVKSLLPDCSDPSALDAWNTRMTRHPQLRRRSYYTCHQILKEPENCIFAIDQNNCVCVWIHWTRAATNIRDSVRCVNHHKGGITLKDDVIENFAADIIKGYYLRWRWRKDHLWNPHDPIGEKYLQMRAERDCSSLM